jgi:glutamate-1-semialdehyde 2,1-aminomutase
MSQNVPQIVTAASPEDAELFDRTLRDFVPPDAFDAHAHLYDAGSLGAAPPPLLLTADRTVGLDEYDRYQRSWMTGYTPKNGAYLRGPGPTGFLRAAVGGARR